MYKKNVKDLRKLNDYSRNKWKSRKETIFKKKIEITVSFELKGRKRKISWQLKNPLKRRSSKKSSNWWYKKITNWRMLTIWIIIVFLVHNRKLA